jgi:hypothetical protein
LRGRFEWLDFSHSEASFGVIVSVFVCISFFDCGGPTGAAIGCLRFEEGEPSER